MARWPVAGEEQWRVMGKCETRPAKCEHKNVIGRPQCACTAAASTYGCVRRASCASAVRNQNPLFRLTRGKRHARSAPQRCHAHTSLMARASWEPEKMPTCRKNAMMKPATSFSLASTLAGASIMATLAR